MILPIVVNIPPKLRKNEKTSVTSFGRQSVIRGSVPQGPTPFVYQNGNEANEQNYRITSSITGRKDVNLFTKKPIILYQYTSSPFLRSSKNYCACVYACVTSENQAFNALPS